MLVALTVLLVFQLVGEVIARGLALPIPGPVVGMLLLTGALYLRKEVPPTLKHTAQTILQHFALLFVPAGVGIMVHLALLQQEWLAILITLLVSTLVTIVVTALVMRFLLRFG